MISFIIGILAIAVVIFAILCVVMWIYSMVRWTQKGGCDESQCDTCPFPCRKHENGPWKGRL